MADEPSLSRPNEEIILFAGKNNDIFVWNAEDVLTLRTKYRIVGSLVGSLPRKPRQNAFLSLPLLLSKEETTLLLQKKFARLVKNEAYPSLPSQNEIEKFKTAREESISGQIKLLQEETVEREKEFEENMEAGRGKKKKRQRKRLRKNVEDDCISPKKAKTEDDVKHLEDDKALVTEIIGDVNDNEKMGKDFVMDMNEKKDVQNVVIPDTKHVPRPLSSCTDTSPKNDFIKVDDKRMLTQEKECPAGILSGRVGPVEVETSQIEQACMIHIPTRMPNTKTKGLATQEWKYPETEREKLKYQVFLDLWEKGFFITPGSKFGGEFLAYPGDPIKFHSFYVVLVVPWTKKIGMLELISIGRLAATVKKTAVLGTVSDEGKVIYSSIKWSGIS